MRNFLFALAFLLSVATVAQPTMGRRPGGAGANMNMGHFYGKIVDTKTNKGIDGVSVQLVSSRMDTVTKKATQQIIKTAISETNGDFSMENLPVFGNYQLKISAIGFKPLEQNVSFGLKMQSGGNAEQMMSMVDKDLGNIKIEQDAATLSGVTVTTTRKLFEMGVDRKIFNVDRNIVSAGQSATEVMKSIPSLSVDIDGNVTLRNASPQLFVDGRPTTLTMEQIPADIIDQVELITNPSAKFDASGGNAGILNIVLKKNKKSGYNGGLRTGADSRGGVQLGGEFSVRQNKVNFFGGVNLNVNKSQSWAITDRTNLLTSPLSRIYQTSQPFSRNLFAMGRGGFDYFVDIRNTISATVNFVQGKSKNEDNPHLDSLRNGVLSSFNDVTNNNERDFSRIGTQLSFKHNFAKNGHTLTADANYNGSKNDGETNLGTKTFNANSTLKYQPVYQKSISTGNSNNLIIQTDYSNPITETQKIELGLRASINKVEQVNNQAFYNYNTLSFVQNQKLSSNYNYSDKVYAAYGTYSLKVKKFSYQLGLRAESSVYSGTVVKNDSSFQVKYPLSLFPSAFITYALSDNEDIQVNASRRINRPNFFQLLPFIDYSDPQNINVGNAGLKPEFTNAFEVSYNKTYGKGANFLVSTFGKYNTNLISRFQYLGANPDLEKFYSSSDSVIFNTYVNANSSVTYGIELTNRMPVVKNWDMTLNVNIFNATINLKDPTGKTPDIKNRGTSWFAKMNNTIKLPKSFSLQISGDYFSKSVVPGEGGRGGGERGGGMMWGGGPTSTAQGYINARYSVDFGIRKDFTLKGGSSASLSFNMNDVFRTQLFSTYSVSPFATQLSERRRNPQTARLNFNYRFGKFDVNLFKRRNDRNIEGGSDTMAQ